MNIYKELGFEDRADYLNDLSEKFGVNPVKVQDLARDFGEDKDFTLLPAAVEDLSYTDLA